MNKNKEAIAMIEGMITEGITDKSEIYDKVMTKLDLPRPSVRRAARTLRLGMLKKVEVLGQKENLPDNKKRDSLILTHLAKLENLQWREWASTLLTEESRNMSSTRVLRWQQLIEKPYDSLSPEEKGKDMIYAMRVLNELKKLGVLK